MRTTVRLDERLLREAKTFAARNGRTLTAVIEDALRQFMARPRSQSTEKPYRVLTFRGTGVAPGVDLDDTAGLLDLLEEGQLLEKRR